MMKLFKVWKTKIRSESRLYLILLLVDRINNVIHSLGKKKKIKVSGDILVKKKAKETEIVTIYLKRTIGINGFIFCLHPKFFYTNVFIFKNLKVLYKWTRVNMIMYIHFLPHLFHFFIFSLSVK